MESQSDIPNHNCEIKSQVLMNWPGEAAHTHQLLHIPQTDQCICTSCGKILACGIKFNADAVGRMGINWLYELELRITETKT